MDNQAEAVLHRIDDAAAMLGISRAQIYRMLRRGELEAVHIGTMTRITAASVKALVERATRATFRPEGRPDAA